MPHKKWETKLSIAFVHRREHIHVNTQQELRLLTQHNYKCNVNTEAADDLMLNKAGCSVITEMYFISHNGCCSKHKCRGRGWEKRRES